MSADAQYAQDAGSLDLSPSTRRGLLLTLLVVYPHRRPQTLLLTGLTRDGVYLIEDGEVTGASTTSGSTRRRSDAVPPGEAGATERAPPATPEWSDYSPLRDAALRIEGFNMSSVSRQLTLFAGTVC